MVFNTLLALNTGVGFAIVYNYLYKIISNNAKNETKRNDDS